MEQSSSEPEGGERVLGFLASPLQVVYEEHVNLYVKPG